MVVNMENILSEARQEHFRRLMPNKAGQIFGGKFNIKALKFIVRLLNWGLKNLLTHWIRQPSADQLIEDPAVKQLYLQCVRHS